MLVYPLEDAVHAHLVEVAAIPVVLVLELREHHDEVSHLLGMRVLLHRPHLVQHPRRLVGKPELAKLLQLLLVSPRQGDPHCRLVFLKQTVRLA